MLTKLYNRFYGKSAVLADIENAWMGLTLRVHAT